MRTNTNFLVAALAMGAVQALPQMSVATFPTTTPVGGQLPSTTNGASMPSSTGGAPAPPDFTDLIANLLTAPTAVKRFQMILAAAGDQIEKFVNFDFNTKRPENQLGGVTKAANIESFPILTGLGISTTLGFLEPCGMNTPHVHPRATEFLTVVEGGGVKFGYILENGLVQEINGSLDKFHGTVFPMGSIHYQFNDNADCKPSTFVAALNSEDPGTSQIAQNFFGLNPDIVNATLGFPKTIDGSNIEQFRKTIPPNLAQGIDKCLQRCNIPIMEFPLKK
ncbi:RmlC-like cupin [Polyplosphaeria fusca]|uniref:RmlC-like cupin n=1 Tax=Polyplosphaeria fusca TaxID=682080 RepID=A0A9P4UYH6_9PLEO|nr:RmlC-like cupin [Polyplosphaeria fusca]